MRTDNPEKGKRYGRLTLTGKHQRMKGRSYWGAVCDCGKEVFTYYHHLVGSKSKSCGCLFDETNTTHGMSKTKIYKVWVSMRQRCNNPKASHYERYGGRGIKVEQRWSSFESFLEDMKEDYKEGLTLERIDNNGNYCKENCKWIPQSEQSKNTSRSVFIDYKGGRYILQDLSRKLGIPYKTLEYRYRRGLALEKN